MHTILIVEDDNDINNVLHELLSLNGYRTIQAYSGTEALIYINKEKIDLILLDLMIPGKSGTEVLNEIRQKSNIPIIALTAITNKDTKIETLKFGSDDYITKPFDNDEVLARIEVQLRKVKQALSDIDGKELKYKDIVLNLETYEATINGANTNLSKREFEILKLLVENPKKVFTKDNIYESVWNDEYVGDENTINVHISKIRTKLSEVKPNEEYIQTIWGIGFKMS